MNWDCKWKERIKKVKIRIITNGLIWDNTSTQFEDVIGISLSATNLNYRSDRTEIRIENYWCRYLINLNISVIRIDY